MVGARVGRVSQLRHSDAVRRSPQAVESSRPTGVSPSESGSTASIFAASGSARIRLRDAGPTGFRDQVTLLPTPDLDVIPHAVLIASRTSQGLVSVQVSCELDQRHCRQEVVGGDIPTGRIASDPAVPLRSSSPVLSSHRCPLSGFIGIEHAKAWCSLQLPSANAVAVGVSVQRVSLGVTSSRIPPDAVLRALPGRWRRSSPLIGPLPWRILTELVGFCAALLSGRSRRPVPSGQSRYRPAGLRMPSSSQSHVAGQRLGAIDDPPRCLRAAPIGYAVHVLPSGAVEGLVELRPQLSRTHRRRCPGPSDWSRSHRARRRG